DHKGLKKLVDAIPRNWVDDKTMRTYVLLLWKELDDRKLLQLLPVRPGVDNVRYAPGAVIWQVDRKDIAKSRMNRIIGTPYYKQITIRSANTMRKLNELTAAPACTARAGALGACPNPPWRGTCHTPWPPCQPALSLPGFRC